MAGSDGKYISIDSGPSVPSMASNTVSENVSGRSISKNYRDGVSYNRSFALAAPVVRRESAWVARNPDI